MLRSPFLRNSAISLEDAMGNGCPETPRSASNLRSQTLRTWTASMGIRIFRSEVEPDTEGSRTAPCNSAQQGLAPWKEQQGSGGGRSPRGRVNQTKAGRMPRTLTNKAIAVSGAALNDRIDSKHLEAEARLQCMKDRQAMCT